MSKPEKIIQYINIHHTSLEDRLNPHESYTYEVVPNPLREWERKINEVKAERARRLEEFKTLFPANQCNALENAIAVLERHGKRLTQEKIVSRLYHIPGREIDLDSFKKISNASRQSGILTNCIDKHGKGYGLPEWGI